MIYIGLDLKTSEFVVESDKIEYRFSGTVKGAVEMREFSTALSLQKKEIPLQSSDMNHPDEFPQFEEHAIDVAAGFFEGAISAGLIEFKASSQPSI